MSKKLFIVFALTWCVLLFSSARAQEERLLKDEEIPKDLVITFESQGVGQHYKFVIKADGAVTYHPISVTTVTLPAEETDAFEMSEADKEKFEKSKKNRAPGALSKSQLRGLIAEFERVNFFAYLDRYSTAEDGCTSWISVPGLKTVSIQINGNVKTVVYESGCIGVEKVSEEFKNLIDKINEITKSVELKVELENKERE